ncbi:Gas vesicle synthesis GvpLGvpF [Candidatus Koribacter versatilis Ellin345]|uniref:Gas vesicle synthesis GvpLGvpF n=1 Tax=Koribacter versatilis (strain Ellin345) TaxID=204669 RepID=Q1INZ0_KORVE|nr:GvpL/GvpF family gas vesicle protein [Candidatus Koribacter versatilis]ABF41410.1 Gas vesicle synthesis GvpLGvpF [Candidatus Koribacter versatilis Ellin345]
MATAIKKKSAKKTAKQPAGALYLYGISLPAKKSVDIRAEAVDGNAAVESIRLGGFDAWISRVDRSEYADRLAENMENLEWLATIGVRHQRAVGDLASKVEILPARFGTVFLSEASLQEHIAGQKKSIQSVFKKIAGAEEWGIKIFRTATPKAPAMIEASSGTDYLKRKAQTVMPRKKEEDPSLAEFVEALSKASADTAAGGKASAGQPSLVWHGSFLVKRTAQKKFAAALKKSTAKLANNYRVECSGPWPPYSFVGQHD